jgi:hypothetical protein
VAAARKEKMEKEMASTVNSVKFADVATAVLGGVSGGYRLGGYVSSDEDDDEDD